MLLASIREKRKTNGISIEFDDMICDLGRLTNILHPLNFQIYSEKTADEWIFHLLFIMHEIWNTRELIFHSMSSELFSEYSVKRMRILPAHNSQLAQEVRTTVSSV